MHSKFIYNNLSPAKAESYRGAFPVVLQGHAPIFTHGDFQRKNIIIKGISPAVSVDASQARLKYAISRIDSESI